MIQAWLADRAESRSLIDRVAALERDLSEMRATITSLNERIISAEARSVATTEAYSRLDRQLRVFSRVTRAGMARLRNLLVADLDRAAQTETVRETLQRLGATIAIVETRIEAEAEQARRGMIGLLRAVEALRTSDTAD